ncbi:6-carboxy-5,6,7,8-tetrahydropterin synthase-like [Sycon ciliatum]|uniref:6-carboxy-5,6,7,8-tetrahydropterin synthase-like n=1 Tax=Sycon ciliatum TaxID=27933 RepID=UPI0031F6ACEA
MITCSRSVEFDAGHRVLNHESKCRTVHGHRYKVDITAQIDELDDIGRVVDFSVLKQVIGGWIDEQWDHAMVLNKDDPMLQHFKDDDHALKPPYVMDTNPTAENMAKFLLDKSNELLAGYEGLKVISVVVHETPNCKAEATF